MPFLTLLDDRAKIKGSRDPLGLQPIWTRFGRQVVRNLTTVTTTVRGFTVLILGLYFAEQAVEQHSAEEADLLNMFLKFEQLAAYSRVAWRNSAGQEDEGYILGIQRVKKNLQERQDRVSISAHQDAQILSNQKTYGLWGLYTVAARNSGLVEPGHSRLTREAGEFIESEYLPSLDRLASQIFRFLNQDRDFEPRGKDSSLGSRLASMLGDTLTKPEIAFYSKHLLFGGVDTSAQARLWQRIRAASLLDAFSMLELKEIIRQTSATGDLDLAEKLQHIQQVETVIAPVGRLFNYLLDQNGQTIDEVAGVLKKELGSLNHLDPVAFRQALGTMKDIEADIQTRLVGLAEALQAGSYAQAIELMLEQNEAVMKGRGGAAWIRLKNRELEVRFKDERESRKLPERDELPNLWINTYFIDSLKSIGYQLS